MIGNDVASFADARARYYAKIGKLNLGPLWEVLSQLVTREPQSDAKPAYWAYRDLRPVLLEAGDVITAEEAERRVLVLQNPGLPGKSAITDTLYAGFQLILPGEVARSHRHTQSALRFVVEGEGAYTSVDGERTVMHPGDFILTPGWTWHDHGNPTSQPMIWLDGLDVPLLTALNASFFESYPQAQQPLSRAEGDSAARFGQGLLPIDWKPNRLSSPVFNYPYARSRETLAAMASSDAPNPWHGHKVRFINPVSGTDALPTIGANLQLLPAEFTTRPYKSTDGAVYFAVEGHGQTTIGDQLFQWSKNDVFVVPSWHTVTHHAEAESVLFSFSDRPVQQAFGLWREAKHVD